MGPTPTGGSSREYWSMGETLNQRRRVEEEGLRVVNSFCARRTLSADRQASGDVIVRIRDC